MYFLRLLKTVNNISILVRCFTLRVVQSKNLENFSLLLSAFNEYPDAQKRGDRPSAVLSSLGPAARPSKSLLHIHDTLLQCPIKTPFIYILIQPLHTLFYQYCFINSNSFFFLFYKAILKNIYLTFSVIV